MKNNTTTKSVNVNSGKMSNYQILVIAGLIIFLQSCAPVFSELQSARTAGKNRVELTPSFSAVSFSDFEDLAFPFPVQYHAGVQAAYGITSKIDLRVRYEYIWMDMEDLGEDGISVIGIGPKFGILKDRIAFSLPVGGAIGLENSWQLHPTLLFTIPAVKDKFDITIAPKYLLTLNERSNGMPAANLGFAISNNLNRWAIRPEYGILFSPLDGPYNHFSLGFSVNLGK